MLYGKSSSAHAAVNQELAGDTNPADIGRPPRPDMDCIGVSINLRRVLRGLITMAVAIACLGAIGQTIRFGLDREYAHGFIPAFKIDGESNFAALFAGVLLFLNGLTALVIGLAIRPTGGRWWRHWIGVAAALGFAALDETVGIHEWYGDEFARYVEGRGFFLFIWVIPGTVVAGALTLIFAPFVLSLEPRTRALVIAGAGIFLTGAIPLDMVASKVFDTYGHRDTIQYATAAMIKESVEMIGSLVCLYAFTGYLTRYLRVQTIRIALSSR